MALKEMKGKGRKKREGERREKGRSLRLHKASG